MPTKTLPLLALLGTALLVGCGGGGDESQPITPGQEVETHSEPDAPHGGHILHGEPHGPVHLEVTFDEEAREITIYPLVEKDESWEAHGLEHESLVFHYVAEDSDEEQELDLAVVADAQPKGSKYVIAGEAIPAEIKDEEELVGHLHVLLDGKDTLFKLKHDHSHHHHGEEGHHEGEEDE